MWSLCFSTQVARVPPEPVRPTPEGLAGPGLPAGGRQAPGTSSSYLSRQVVGKAARVRHMAAGSGQHVVERMVTGSSGHHEPPRTPGGRRAGAAAAQHAASPSLAGLLWSTRAYRGFYSLGGSGAGPSAADQSEGGGGGAGRSRGGASAGASGAAHAAAAPRG